MRGKNVHIAFYSNQFLRWFIRINYTNMLFSLYDNYTCMTFLTYLTNAMQKKI